MNALTVWQTTRWLTGDQPEATSMFRMGVMLQLSGAIAIAVLSLAALLLARRHVT